VRPSLPRNFEGACSIFVTSREPHFTTATWSILSFSTPGSNTASYRDVFQNGLTYCSASQEV
jgi:hypothetical protein